MRKGNSTSSGFPVFPAIKKLHMRDGELPTPLGVHDSMTPPVTTCLVVGIPSQTYGLVKSDGYKDSPVYGPIKVTLAAYQSGKPGDATQGRTYHCESLKTCKSDTLMDPLFQGETATSEVPERYADFTPRPTCDVRSSYSKNSNSKYIGRCSCSNSSTCCSNSSKCSTSNTSYSTSNSKFTYFTIQDLEYYVVGFQILTKSSLLKKEELLTSTYN